MFIATVRPHVRRPELHGHLQIDRFGRGSQGRRGECCLKISIETHCLTQSEVAAGTSMAESTVSEILAGKQKLSMKHVEALARFFKVKAAVFLDE
jgi:Helix-turn-helix